MLGPRAGARRQPRPPAEPSCIIVVKNVPPELNTMAKLSKHFRTYVPWWLGVSTFNDCACFVFAFAVGGSGVGVGGVVVVGVSSTPVSLSARRLRTGF
jgi:hypothetical protein